MTAGTQSSAQSLNILRRWFVLPKPAHAYWIGKHCTLLAWAGILIALLSPPHGSGIPLCFFESATHVPCPGCGMTRSLSCAIRGMFTESWNYHPFGLFVLALFLLTAVQSLFPKSRRDRLAKFMQSHSRFFNRFYTGFVVAFISFGVLRAVVHCMHRL